MIRLYTAATPNGRKASIALEELGLAYEVQRVDISAPEHPTAEFLALTPNHRRQSRRPAEAIENSFAMEASLRCTPEGYPGRLTPRCLPRSPRRA